MDFNPNNPIVQRCLEGMTREDQGNPEEASLIYRQAWEEASNDFEQFLAAYYIARLQEDPSGQLQWLTTAVQHAQNTNTLSANSALPNLYRKMATCHNALQEPEQASRYEALADQTANQLADAGPFYHGTKANLQVGDQLTAGYRSNYRSEITMNHIYFTALIHGAGLAAELAAGEAPPRVYLVEPTGPFENDPNVTDKKFPGNPTRSYRTLEPLKIVGETTDWTRLTPEQLQGWKDKLAKNKGEIIN
ncbi:MAG: NAD(+)--rifampin ADP-ribosyltransferase [Saprospiraceae bacterium]